MWMGFLLSHCQAKQLYHLFLIIVIMWYVIKTSEQAFNSRSNLYSIAHCCVTSFVLYAVIRHCILQKLSRKTSGCHPFKLKYLLKWKDVDKNNKLLGQRWHDSICCYSRIISAGAVFVKVTSTWMSEPKVSQQNIVLLTIMHPGAISFP